MIWFTSDQHYFHDKVIKFCNRPFSSLEEMHQVLIARYRSKVRPGDTVYFGGDIFFGSFQEAASIMDQLPGKKILIQGNHDKFSQNQYRALGFEFVAEEMLLRLFGRRIRLCHYPRRPSLWRRLFGKADIRYMDRRPPHDGRWLIHGHTHSPEKVNLKKRQIHIGVDAWDYRPVNLKEIESLIAKTEQR